MSDKGASAPLFERVKMATKKQSDGMIEAVCLRDSHFGNVGDIVTLSGSDAKTGAEMGAVDSHPSAVAYAKENK